MSGVDRVIEVNDAELTVYGAAGIESRSPGYALINSKVLVGMEAWQQARLDPRRIYHEFWDQLDQEAIPRQAGGLRSNADLAFAHLSSVWAGIADDTASVLLAVPGHYTRQQLGLLLGIARECGIPVNGMIDSAVAAAQPAAGSTLIHLDIHLHRVVLTRLSQGARLARSAVDDSALCGLVGMREAWVNAIADAFVRATRFDPLHLGETEQEAYACLPEWLAAVSQSGSATVQMQAGSKTHSVLIKRERLEKAASTAYQAIEDLVAAATRPGEPVILQLSQRLAHFPGLQERLTALPGVKVNTLPAAAVGDGALRHAEYIRAASGESVAFVTHVPMQAGGPQVAGPDSGAPQRPQPTHVLYRSRAYALGAEPVLIGTSIPAGSRGFNLGGRSTGISRTHCALLLRDGVAQVEDRSTYGTFLNEARVEGSAPVAAGDRLRIGSPGQELQMIELVD